ncbi:MAG: 50S ribosomal protein L18e, partial [Candidatus Woesearchaeota archaeon]
IETMREKGHKEKIPFLLEVADKLESSRRINPEVNLSKLNRVCKDNETVVVPGKVLSSGSLSKPLTVVAANFSMAAIEKVNKAGGKTMSIGELVEKNPKGTSVRIVI